MILRLCILIFLVISCAGHQITSDMVIDKVSLDKKCPKKDISILNHIIIGKQGSYQIQACDKIYNYEHRGQSIYEFKAVSPNTPQ